MMLPDCGDSPLVRSCGGDFLCPESACSQFRGTAGSVKHVEENSGSEQFNWSNSSVWSEGHRGVKWLRWEAFHMPTLSLSLSPLVSVARGRPSSKLPVERGRWQWWHTSSEVFWAQLLSETSTLCHSRDPKCCRTAIITTINTCLYWAVPTHQHISFPSLGGFCQLMFPLVHWTRALTLLWAQLYRNTMFVFVIVYFSKFLFDCSQVKTNQGCVLMAGPF